MKSHDSCATIGLSTNHRHTEENMGRKHLTLKQHCRGSHFTWAERLKLQYYWTGSNGYRKIRSHTLLGKIFQKSLKTIKRELQRGMGGKGPQPKSGRHHALAARISELMLVNHYSPYAVLKRLDEEKAWPKGLMICEKTLYNWIEARDIPDVTIENLPRQLPNARRPGTGKVTPCIRQRTGILRCQGFGTILSHPAASHIPLLRPSLLLVGTGNQREPQWDHQKIPAQRNRLRKDQEQNGEGNPTLDEHLPQEDTGW